MPFVGLSLVSSVSQSASHLVGSASSFLIRTMKRAEPLFIYLAADHSAATAKVQEREVEKERESLFLHTDGETRTAAPLISAKCIPHLSAAAVVFAMLK